MNLKSIQSVLILLWFVLFVPFGAISNIPQQNQLTKAIQLFDKGNYVEAEVLFKTLIDERPDDFMINYFYGACRTNNGHYSDKTLSYLKKASLEVNPLDIDYYMGVQNHAKENWEKALEHYEIFRKTASEEEQKKVKLDEKTEQCRKHINPFRFEFETMSSSPEIVEKNINSDTISDTVSTDTKIQETELIIPAVSENTDISVKTETDSLEKESLIKTHSPEDNSSEEGDTLNKEKTKNKIRTSQIISFIINPEISYRSISDFKTEEAKENYEQGIQKQNKLEQTLKIAAILREKYVASKSRVEKDSIGKIILDLENETYELKNESNNLLANAKSIENDYWQKAPQSEVAAFIDKLNLTSNEIKETKIEDNKNQKDSTALIIPPILIHDTDVQKSTARSSGSNIIYKIQMGAFSRGIPNYLKPLFKKMELIRKVETYTDKNGVVVYTTGNLTNLDDALIMQKQVRQEGVEDAYIVPFLSGKRITLEQAKEIEDIK